MTKNDWALGAAGTHLVPAVRAQQAVPHEALQGLPDFVDQALGWVHERLDLFRPLDEPASIDLIALKATAELTLACSNLVRSGLRDARLTNLIAACEETARASEFRRAVREFPHLVYLFAPIVGGLLRCGLDDRELNKLVLLLQQTYDQGYVFAVERTPSQTMDLVYVLDVCQIRHGFPPMENLLQHSIVGKQPPVAYLTDPDVYDMTHVLFAVCDMGFAIQPTLPSGALRWTLSATDALLNAYVKERDWDIVGELLLVCRCLGFMPEPVFSDAWRALTEAQSHDGFVPDTSYSSSHANGEYGHEKRWYEFVTNYHPTIVALVAGVLTQDWLANSRNTCRLRPLVSSANCPSEAVES